MNGQKMEERARAAAQEDESGGIRATEGEEKNEKEKVGSRDWQILLPGSHSSSRVPSGECWPGERQRDGRGLSTSLNFSLGSGQSHFIRTPLSSACTVADLVARNFCFFCTALLN
jgi:hypothetical protein